MSTCTVYLLDDNEEFRASTAFLLEAMGYDVQHFAEYDEALHVLSKVPVQNAACLLLDIRMPKISGLDVHDLMLQRDIDIPVIYMTAHGDVPLAVTAMRKGALTFLEKPLNDDALQAALQQALSVQVQSTRKSQEEREALADAKELMKTLTAREYQVVRCVVNHSSNKEVARELNISVKTVELHRSRAMHKLQAKNVAQLIRIVLACDADKAA